MQSGGGVLLIASLQLILGLVLLGIYEGYKTAYLSEATDTKEGQKVDSVTGGWGEGP
jgi:hypothetical protein